MRFERITPTACQGFQLSLSLSTPTRKMARSKITRRCISNHWLEPAIFPRSFAPKKKGGGEREREGGFPLPSRAKGYDDCWTWGEKASTGAAGVLAGPGIWSLVHGMDPLWRARPGRRKERLLAMFGSRGGAKRPGLRGRGYRTGLDWIGEGK